MTDPSTPLSEDESNALAALRAALTFVGALPGEVMAYRGTLRGIDVVIVGYATLQSNGRFECKPLGLLMTENLFDQLEVSDPDVKRVKN